MCACVWCLCSTHTCTRMHAAVHHTRMACSADRHTCTYTQDLCVPVCTQAFVRVQGQSWQGPLTTALLSPSLHTEIWVLCSVDRWASLGPFWAGLRVPDSPFSVVGVLVLSVGGFTLPPQVAWPLWLLGSTCGPFVRALVLGLVAEEPGCLRPHWG